jgi:hypothetical protein
MHRNERARAHQLDHPELLGAVGVPAHVHRAIRPPGAELNPAPQAGPLITRMTSGSLPGMTRLDRTTRSPASRSNAGCSPASRAAPAPPPPPPASRRRRPGWPGGAARARAPPATRGPRPLEVRPARVLARRARRRPRHAGVRRDAAAQQDDLAAVASRDVSEHPQAVDVGREHADDDRLLRPGHHLVERAPHAFFAPRRSGGVDVGRVAQQEPDALAASSSKRSTSKVSPSGGASSNLKSPVWTTRPGVGPDRQRRRVGDRVGHPNGFDLERADPFGRSRRHARSATCARISCSAARSRTSPSA